YTGNRIAVRFAYEYHDDSGNWFRAYGNENWEFDENGLMRQRHASINDLPIRESERKFHWDRSRPRPADHPGLTDLGLSPGPRRGSCRRAAGSVPADTRGPDDIDARRPGATTRPRAAPGPPAAGGRAVRQRL